MKKEELIFLAKFFVIYGALQTIIYYADLSALTNWIALIEASFFSLPYNENKIFAENVTFVINNSCSGLVSISILAAIVFGLKNPEIRKKIPVFLISSIILFGVNIVRIAGIIYVGLTLGSHLVEPVHVASWFFMSGAIIALWYHLTKKIAKIENFSELL